MLSFFYKNAFLPRKRAKRSKSGRVSWTTFFVIKQFQDSNTQPYKQLQKYKNVYSMKVSQPHPEVPQTPLTHLARKKLFEATKEAIFIEHF